MDLRRYADMSTSDKPVRGINEVRERLNAVTQETQFSRLYGINSAIGDHRIRKASLVEPVKTVPVHDRFAYSSHDRPRDHERTRG